MGSGVSTGADAPPQDAAAPGEAAKGADAEAVAAAANEEVSLAQQYSEVAATLTPIQLKRATEYLEQLQMAGITTPNQQLPLMKSYVAALKGEDTNVRAPTGAQSHDLLSHTRAPAHRLRCPGG